MKIGIYAATGRSVGLGHLKRCLAFSKELQNLSWNVKFLVDNTLWGDLIRRSGFLFSNVSSLTNDEFKMIIIDKYDIDEKLLQFLKKKCSILVRIDDGYPELFKDTVSDIIINPNPYGNETDYINHAKRDCHLIVGKNFIPMDQSFCDLRNTFCIRDEMQNLVIAFGASDNIEWPQKILQEIVDYQLFSHIYVLNGKPLENSLDLRIDKRIKLLPIMDNVAKLFSISDLVICSSSTICWQLSTIGLPFIAFQTAKNQTGNFKYIRQTGYGVALREHSIRNGDLKRHVIELDKPKRLYFYENARKDIPCDGSSRIAQQLDSFLR